MAKTENIWKTKTVGEWAQSGASVWRAQLSIAPDGKKLAGIRQHIITAKRGELVGRNGFSLWVDEHTLDSISAIEGLLANLKASLTKKSPAKKVSPSQQYLLVNQVGKYLKSTGSDGTKVTSDPERAQIFSHAQSAVIMGRFPKRWKREVYSEQ
jgi:hypothetical protein